MLLLVWFWSHSSGCVGDYVSWAFSFFRSLAQFAVFTFVVLLKYWLRKVIEESNYIGNVFPFSRWLTFCGFAATTACVSHVWNFDGQCLALNLEGSSSTLLIKTMISCDHHPTAPLSTWVYRFIVALNEWNFGSSLSYSINFDRSTNGGDDTQKNSPRSFVYIAHDDQLFS